jgi:hypothetical protein
MKASALVTRITKYAMKLTMHGKAVLTARYVVQGINILGYEEIISSISFLKLNECFVSGVGGYIFDKTAQFIKERVYAPEITIKRFMRSDIFNAPSMP